MFVITVLALCLKPIGAPAQTVPVFKFTEHEGPYAVGLQVVEQYDNKRKFRDPNSPRGRLLPGSLARPLQTLIWYPALKTDARPMTVQDYFYLAATAMHFGELELSGKWKERLGYFAPTLADYLWAVRDAPPLHGHFPLVIYAAGAGGSAAENADLCEYLASHGYTVIASPSIGATTVDMAFNPAGANAQARDISFLIDYAKDLPYADTSKVAVVGFSWGGLAGLFASARDSRIRALVSLDGSLRYYPEVVAQAGDVRPDRMTLPLLAFTQGEISLEEERQDFREAGRGPNVLNEWTHGDLVTIHMLGLAHAEFSAMNQRNEAVWKKITLKNDYRREDGVPGYALVARYTQQFLDAYIKHEPAAMSYLKQAPSGAGVPAHTLTVNFRPAKSESGSLRETQRP
jgi:pimeloyl-ACP methyl ester carboxylesterase